MTISKGVSLFYLDTSTPLMRKNGVEQLNTQLFLKPAPPIMRWILKKFYLQDIVDKYYDLRRVVLDLVANFYKEQKPEIIPDLIELTNQFFSENAVINDLIPLTSDEVKDYYGDDASTWKLYLRVRRFHRFVSTKILRRYYDYILPRTIQR
jgi:predicted AAA+ superfamily ATPase